MIELDPEVATTSMAALIARARATDASKRARNAQRAAALGAPAPTPAAPPSVPFPAVPPRLDREPTQSVYVRRRLAEAKATPPTRSPYGPRPPTAAPANTAGAAALESNRKATALANAGQHVANLIVAAAELPDVMALAGEAATLAKCDTSYLDQQLRGASEAVQRALDHLCQRCGITAADATT